MLARIWDNKPVIISVSCVIVVIAAAVAVIMLFPKTMDADQSLDTLVVREKFRIGSAASVSWQTRGSQAVQTFTKTLITDESAGSTTECYIAHVLVAFPSPATTTPHIIATTTIAGSMALPVAVSVRDVTLHGFTAVAMLPAETPAAQRGLAVNVAWVATV